MTPGLQRRAGFGRIVGVISTADRAADEQGRSGDGDGDGDGNRNGNSNRNS